MIYMDYASTTPIDEEVLDSYIKVQKNFFANTTSLHKLGVEANYFYEKAKKELLEILGLNNFEVIYTSNATEANNIGIYGWVNNKRGKVITTKIEHPSVYEIFLDLQKKGYEVVFLDTDENGFIDLSQLEKELDDNTILVSTMWVNNIVGAIQPIDKVIELVKRYPKCRLHVDAVQGICKVNQNFSLNNIDMITFSTHKIYGPKGIGCLIYKQNMALESIIHGSNSQHGLKPGTFDLALVVATTKAIKKFYPSRIQEIDYVQNLKNKFIELIKNNNNIVINSRNENYSPFIINISIPNINGETIVHYLESKEVYVSTGSSCSSKLKKPEKTIYEMTKSNILATTTIRLSFSHITTINEVIQVCHYLNEITGVNKNV